MKLKYIPNWRYRHYYKYIAAIYRQADINNKKSIYEKIISTLFLMEYLKGLKN